MWFGQILTYEEVYICCENSIHYYYDKKGNFLTRTYKEAHPGNAQSLSWYEALHPGIITTQTTTNRKLLGVDYMCSVEFTLNGLIYMTSDNYWIDNGGGKLLYDVKCEYFFVPYEDE